MNDRNDLTNGSITDKMIFIALPIIGTQLMQMAYNLTDMFWLGRLGEDAVAASGAAGMYLWLSAAFMIFGQMGASIGVSQNIGRGDRAEAARFAEVALVICTALGLVFTAAMMLFRAPLIGFFQIREAHVDVMAQQYLLVVAPFVPISFIGAVITSCYTAAGDSRTPFFINCVGLVINIVLDPLLIFTFGWGIKGAAAATVTAQLVASALLIFVVKRSPNRPFAHIRLCSRPDAARTRQILVWALPVALESLLFTLLSMGLSRIIAFWGAGVIAVLRVGSQLESLTWMIGEGYSTAVTAYTGQNYGAGKWQRIRKGFTVSTAIMAGWGILVMTLLFLFPRQLMGAFLRTPDTIRLGVDYLHISAISQVFMCMEFVSAGAFRGMGRTFPPSLVSIGMNVSRLILAYFLAGTAFGLNGVWWAINFGAIGRGVVLFIWYKLYARRLPREDTAVSS